MTYLEHTSHEFLYGLEAAVRDELVEIDISHSAYLLALPVSDWPFDPTEGGSPAVRLRILLGAIEALRSCSSQGAP